MRETQAIARKKLVERVSLYFGNIVAKASKLRIQLDDLIEFLDEPLPDENSNILDVRVGGVHFYLSPKTTKALKAKTEGSIETIRDLIRYTEKEIFQVKGITRDGLAEVKSFLAAHNLKLAKPLCNEAEIKALMNQFRPHSKI